jgi:hypothetical protein
MRVLLILLLTVTTVKGQSQFWIMQGSDNNVSESFNYYISNAGSNSNDGTSKALAKQTLSSITSLYNDNTTFGLSPLSRFNESLTLQYKTNNSIKCWDSTRLATVSAMIPVPSYLKTNGYTNIYDLDITPTAVVAGISAQIIALKAGMSTPVRRWASRPSSKEDAVNKMLTNKLIDIELF